jgi:hypothetical protein
MFLVLLSGAIVLVLVLAFLISLFFSAYIVVLDFRESMHLVVFSIIIYFSRSMKAKVYKEVHDDSLKKNLHKLHTFNVKGLAKVNPKLSLDELNALKMRAGELLKSKEYIMSLEEAKKEMKSIGLYNFFYSFQSYLVYSADPKHLSLASAPKKEKIKNHKQFLIKKHKVSRSEQQRLSKYFASIDNKDDSLSTILNFKTPITV